MSHVLFGTRRRSWSRVCSVAIAIAMCASFVGVPLTAVAAPGVPTYESEPNDTAAQANALAVDGTIMNGEYATSADDDWYAVNLLAGHAYGFQMGPNTDQPSIMSDVWLELWDPTATVQLASCDDWFSLFSAINFTAPADGTYYLKTSYLSHSYTGPYGIRAFDTATFGIGAATISGTVTDVNDDPIEGVQVTGWGLDPWYASFPYLSSEIGNATTAVDGTYTMDAGVGNNTVGFFADGYFDQYYNQKSDFDSADAVPAVADDVITGIDARLEELPPLDTFVMDTVRVSVDANGEQGMDDSESYRGSRSPAISADGAFVAFYSGNRFVEEDTNDLRDWYLKNVATGELMPVSVADDESPANDDYDDGEGRASVSGDGRYVAFDSDASNLVGADVDTNGYEDIFVRDMADGTTVRVSVATDGTEGNANSYDPSISDDGRYVSFSSDASTLVEGDDNGSTDIFVHDLQTGSTTRVSVDAEGGQAGTYSVISEISGDGSTVAFVSAAGLVEDDTNGYADVYVKTLADGSIARASVASDGTEANDNSSEYDFPTLSVDGQLVAFISDASNLVDDDANEERDVFMHDCATGETSLVSLNSAGEQTYDYPEDPSMSADGRFVTFEDEAQDAMGLASVSDWSLVSGDVNDEDDIVLKDMLTGDMSMVTVSSEGNPADDASYGPVISADGMVVAYTSDATGLVADDTNERSDVFAGYISLEPTDVTETPLEGEDRYGTSIEVSQDTFPDGADAVVIATGENWPDALGGSALAGVLGGPVLLSRKAALPEDVAAEIERLGATEAYVLGDYRALSNSVYNSLVDMLGSGNVHRIGGTDRYGTANLVAAEVVGLLGTDYDGTAFVATGNNFADALAASPLAAANGWPVYLSGLPTISDDTIVAMQDAGVADCILLGGEAAMPEGTSIVILGAGFTAVRIDGADRYETAAKVAEYGVTDAGLAWDGVAIATGERFPDALSGGVAQGLNGSVLLLSRSTSLSPATQAALADNAGDIGSVRFLGGLPALSQAVRDAVMAIFTP